MFSHRHWTMEVFMALTGEETLPEGFEWVAVDSLKNLAFPEVYQKVMRLMEDRPASI